MIKNKIISILMAATVAGLSMTNISAYAVSNAILPESDNISISVDSRRIGNIFLGSQEPEFTVEYENSSNADVCFTAVYKIFGYDTKMNKQEISSGSRVIRINANSKYTDTIKPKAEKFGTYTLDVEIKNDLQGSLIKNKEVDFSRSVIGKRNSSLGVNTHFTVYGDINQSLHLINNAGMSMIRDTIRWNEYEPVKEERNLTSQTKKLINLSAEYNIDVLPIIFAKNKLYENSDSAMVTTQEGLSG